MRDEALMCSARIIIAPLMYNWYYCLLYLSYIYIYGLLHMFYVLCLSHKNYDTTTALYRGGLGLLHISGDSGIMELNLAST